MRHSRMGLRPRNTPTVQKFIAKAEISGFGGLAGIAQGAKGLLAGQGQFLLLATLQGPDLALDEHLWHPGMVHPPPPGDLFMMLLVLPNFSFRVF